MKTPRRNTIRRGWLGGALNTTMSTGDLVIPALSSANRRGGRGSRGFTLIEIMVVILLLAVIVLGLMAMFDETQRAFRAGMAQTDVMEAGRMYNDMIVRELEQVTPSYRTNALNFFAEIPNSFTPQPQALPGDTMMRTNILEDLFFMTRNNQTWNGIGYYVRTNAGYGGFVDPVGTLYRFETNIPVSQFNATPWQAFQTYLAATNPPSINISKIMDGVVEFRVHCFDTNGDLLTGFSYVTNNYVNISNALPAMAPNEMSFYAFSNNIVPAYVEVELGVLEPAVLRRYKSIPAPIAKYNFLSNHAGNVEIFRQRIAIRNVDPSAYMTNYTPAPF